MLDSVRIGLGYDEFGNNTSLLTGADKRNLEAGRVRRVGGTEPCPGCGEPFHFHPQVQGALWARRGCYELVKL